MIDQRTVHRSIESVRFRYSGVMQGPHGIGPRHFVCTSERVAYDLIGSPGSNFQLEMKEKPRQGKAKG